MQQRTTIWLVILAAAHAAVLVAVVLAMHANANGGGSDPGPGASPAPRVPGPGEPLRVENFVDAHDEPPPGWTGPAFRLSQHYPPTLAAMGPAPWTQIDFRTDTVNYLNTVLKYALEGNTEVDFRGQDNAVRKWYHAPWLHTGDSGREFIHGMTKERHSRPRELAPTQTEMAENWAVGMYNERGGFTLGQVWKNRDAPDPAAAKFPEGTVAFKLLFTRASLSQVPFLTGSLEWQADADRAQGDGPRPTVRLVQIDVAARDHRADATTGWVFGTFIYNGNADGETVWDRMVPVGAMWGNDPARLADNGPLEETVINPEARPIVQHLGFQGRLNGPIDNPRSSCLSCHSTAQIPPDLSDETVGGVPPANATPAVLAQYFRNIPAQTPFTAGQLSLDYSLQLQNGIANHANETQLRFPAPATALGPHRRPLRASREIRVKPVER